MLDFFETFIDCLFIGLGFVSIPLVIFFLIELYYKEKVGKKNGHNN